MIIKKIKKENNGQIMMITVMVLSGVIIGAAAISGILTIRQTRQTADAGNSSKAVFSADAGLEWRVYKLYNDYKSHNLEADYVANPCFNCPQGDNCSEQPAFGDSAVSVNTTCSSEMVQKCDNSDPPICSDYYAFAISSAGSIKDSSYVYSQKINLIK